MKVKYIGVGSLKSKGHTFEAGETYELLNDTFKYMTTTFAKLFEIVEDAPKVEEKEEEVEAPKAKPTKSKTVKRTIAPSKE